MKIFKLSLVVLLVIKFAYCKSQNNQAVENKPYSTEIPNINLIINILSNKGYENIDIYTTPDTLYIAFENRKYRWETKAIVEIINTVLPLSKDCKELCLVTQINGLPIIQVILNIKKIIQFQSGDISVKNIEKSIQASYDITNFKQHINHGGKNNSSFNKFDIIIHPQYKVQFGNYTNPVKSQLNISPALNISLWKGMQFTSQIIFPLHNELELEGNYIRPGIISINQLIKLPLHSFAYVNIGYFTNERYGINIDLNKYFLNGKFILGAKAGYTGYATVLKRKWNYSEINLFTWFTNITYRNAKYDLTSRVGYGSYIAKDKGWRFDISRQFGEITIGFYGMKTNSILNGGVNFVIPIPSRKYSTKRIVRIRPASYFSWEYRAKRIPTEGKIFNTVNNLNDILSFYNPDYIKRYIIIELK